MKLRPDAQIFWKRDGSVTFRFRTSLTFQGLDSTTVRWIENLTSSHNVQAAPPEALSPQVKEIMVALRHADMLVSWRPNSKVGTPLERVFDYFREFSDNPEEALEKLRTSRVLVLGCGGTGTQVAMALAASGVGYLSLLDNDRVHPSNLNRQVAYSQMDVGSLKAVALARHLGSRFPDLRATPIVGRVSSASSLAPWVAESRPNLIVSCIDSPPIRCLMWVAHACQRANIPCLFGGVGLRSGTLGPLLTNGSAREVFLQTLDRFANRLLLDRIPVTAGSLATTNAVIANLIASDAIAFLSGLGPCLSLGRVLRLPFDTLVPTTLATFQGHAMATPPPYGGPTATGDCRHRNALANPLEVL